MLHETSTERLQNAAKTILYKMVSEKSLKEKKTQHCSIVAVFWAM